MSNLRVIRLLRKKTPHYTFRLLQSAARVTRRYSTQSSRYDLVVIGGGSGGLACSKQAAELGKKVAVLDFVDPSSQGTTWGLGGTCVNVGCIPKKLMHHAAISGHALTEAPSYGWVNGGEATHDWSVLRENVTNHVRSLNFGHRVALMDKDVEYLNARGSLVNQHTVKAVNKHNEEAILEADKIVIATGMRPKMLNDVPGMTEHSITSDDLFWLEKAPGKTLVIGGSYVALESAGFLTGLGYDTTVMLRSIPLRGFDQQMADLILSNMKVSGTTVIQGDTPQRVTKQASGQFLVESTTSSDVYDTVLLASGREAQTRHLGLEDVGVELDRQSYQIIGGRNSDSEQSSVDNIYAIGDILYGRPELTPVAIQAGKLLARRMFDSSSHHMDYDTVPTTVFTPLEYSCVGLSEEQAVDKYGADSIEVYHAYYKPLEYMLPHKDYDQCYIKVICMREAPHTVLGIHHTGPNSGEIMQGFAVALRCGLTMDVLKSTVGIHPTIAEELVKIHITKRSGLDPAVTGC